MSNRQKQCGRDTMSMIWMDSFRRLVSFQLFISRLYDYFSSILFVFFIFISWSLAKFVEFLLVWRVLRGELVYGFWIMYALKNFFISIAVFSILWTINCNLIWVTKIGCNIMFCLINKCNGKWCLWFRSLIWLNYMDTKSIKFVS